MKVIYKATNLHDGCVYIGQTNNLTRRIREHAAHAKKDGGWFHEDIQFYGINTFEFEVLEEVPDELADERERYYIDLARKTIGDHLYNICDGGFGGQTHDIHGKNNPMYGKPVSEERRKELSDKLKGRPKSPEHNARVSAALKGKPKSPEAVAKKSNPITIQNIQTGEILHFPSKAEARRRVRFDYCKASKTNGTSKGFKLVEKV